MYRYAELHFVFFAIIWTVFLFHSTNAKQKIEDSPKDAHIIITRMVALGSFISLILVCIAACFD